jgi:hypothetical protein
MTKPEYTYIEFCSNPKALWGKIASKHWDWLGIDGRGTYVLGNPRRTGVIAPSAATTTGDAGSVPGDHTVSVCVPDGAPDPSEHHCVDEPAAVAEFRATLARLQALDGPQLFLVRRLEYQELKQEEYVVTRPPTVP